MDDSDEYDCIVCGSCVVDVLVRPLPLHDSIVAGQLYHVEPLQLETGGVVSNSGATFARLGMKVAGFSFIGNDEFGSYIRTRYESLGIDTVGLTVHPVEATSTTAVLIDSQGERTFAHCVGAPRELDIKWFEKNLDLFLRGRSAVIGYFSLMPKLEANLPQVLEMLQEVNCLTVLETAGTGGTLEELSPSLPVVDVYIPSFQEASNQTKQTNAREIIKVYRDQGAKGVVGVKLGAEGAMVSPSPEEFVEIEAVKPPGAVLDTTGAGDAFLAGYVAGMLKGLTPADSGRLAAAAGACCVTGLGASQGLRNYAETASLAGLTSVSATSADQLSDSAAPNTVEFTLMSSGVRTNE
ncbi:carbohydrate kinase family protein [Bythopirellula polymerisocia]|uniref:Putative sugar kinase YdjH n=1 Tax=Bythopirellula polymerisocia TaxID=2528003 RepID=A0A5C6CHT3_9BACT|nr:carbohydrate kinase family protein [Bythopirellula polymerisocia]TWU22786.1 putative sugar kinase YdjH [Bythopirellula polymerisocia]